MYEYSNLKSISVVSYFITSTLPQTHILHIAFKKHPKVFLLHKTTKVASSPRVVSFT